MGGPRHISALLAEWLRHAQPSRSPTTPHHDLPWWLAKARVDAWRRLADTAWDAAAAIERRARGAYERLVDHDERCAR